MTSSKLLDDCFLHDRDRMRHDDAVALLRERLAPVVGRERVPLATAHRRVLAEEIIAPRPIPLHDNAAVDGYGFAHAAYLARDGAFSVTLRAAAGLAAPTDDLSPGHAARIFTGAALPPGVDTVAMQEDVRVDGDTITVPAGLKAGANCRRAGEDVAEGSPLAVEGHRLRAQDIAGLASAGVSVVTTFKPLRIAIYSTGDEVKPADGSDLAYGQVFDANAPMLAALCDPIHADVTMMGILPDDADVVRDQLGAAAESHDVVITSGGASRGEEDHVVRVLDEIGQRHFWQIAVKPGRPMSFGQIKDTVFIGFPGNPVAVFVCFLLYGWPMLQRLSGAQWPTVQRFDVPAAFTIENKKTERREFWRGTLIERDGALWAQKYMRDGSGLISSLRSADVLIDVKEDVRSVAEGENVSVIPLSQFGIPFSGSEMFQTTS